MQGVADEPVLLHTHGGGLPRHGRRQEELRPHPRLSGCCHALLLGPGLYSVLFIYYNALFKIIIIFTEYSLWCLRVEAGALHAGGGAEEASSAWGTVTVPIVQYSTVEVQYSTVKCSKVQYTVSTCVPRWCPAPARPRTPAQCRCILGLGFSNFEIIQRMHVCINCKSPIIGIF